MASYATQFDTPHAAGGRQINVGSTERNLSLLGGGLLLLSGLRRGGFGGIICSLLGGFLTLPRRHRSLSALFFHGTEHRAATAPNWSPGTISA